MPLCRPCNSGNYLMQTRLLHEKKFATCAYGLWSQPYTWANTRASEESHSLNYYSLHVTLSAYNEFDAKIRVTGKRKSIKILNHNNREMS